MERWLLIGGIALCLACLWAIGRHDWLRLTRPRRRVTARVVGHAVRNDGDGPTYAPRYRFHDGLAEQEVTDQVHGPSRQPPEGAFVELVYPDGRPDLARPSRPLLWWWVYGVLLYALAMIVARALGLIGGD